ncbi:MAG: hypothetical protein ACHP84_11200 [Caulobacterales bacterium]
MGQAFDSKLAMVRGLIEQAPDSAIRSLQIALSADGGHDAALSRVQQVVEVEAAERRARNLTFAPVAGLCAPPGPFSRLTFPPRTLSLMWRALKETAADDVVAARALADDWRQDEHSAEAFDKLCALAAEGLRSRAPASFARAAECADAGGGAETLAACLDLAAITRLALDKLPEWLGRMNSEKAATLRLAYRDVVTMADDGGPRFFEMLAAPLTEPWLILRVISGEMDRPNETYLAASELASFGERVLEDIERRVAEVTSFKQADGEKAAHAAAAAVHWATIEIVEFELCVALTPDGDWGRRMARAKQTLAATIEANLKATDDAVGAALPLQPMRLGPRTVRGVPRLSHPPDQALVAKARTLLVFMSEVRSSAAAGGFASARAKAQEVLDERLDTYVEDILETIRSEEAADKDRARTFLSIAAEFCGLSRDEKAAQIVRRRAAAT